MARIIKRKKDAGKKKSKRDRAGKKTSNKKGKDKVARTRTRTRTTSKKDKKAKGKPPVTSKDPNVNRRIYVCNLLLKNEHTDERIMSMTDRKFPDDNPLLQKRLARIRRHINAGKFEDIKVPKKKLERISK